jgi:acetate kinase
VFHYATNVGNAALPLHITRAEEILNKESGWKSLTGTTSFADISSSNEPNKKLAFDIFVNRILGYLGSYYVSLNGRVDALVFAGGIGGQSDKLRQRVTEEASCLGFTIDAELNKKLVDEVQDVGRKGAKHKTLVCKTNEQFEMARYCAMDTEIFNI